jgi:hypothetical protein
MSLPELPQTQMLSIKVDDEVTLNLAKLMRIDSGNLTREYETHAGWQAYVAALHADAQIRTMRKENELEHKESERFLYLKENFEKIYGYKPTMELLKMAVNTDPGLQEIRDEIVDLKAVEAQFFAARQSFLGRKDMLVSLGAHERSERKTSPA